MRILFADPHPHFGPLVIPQFLAEHEVRWVPTLAEAREALRQGDFAAVLVDLDFPDGSGVDLVRELRDRSFRGRIVAISAKEAGNEALERAGAHATCAKARFQGIAGALPSEPARRLAAVPPASMPAPSPAPPPPRPAVPSAPPPPTPAATPPSAAPSGLTLPVLEPPFAEALQTALREVVEPLSPLAVLAAGSAVRGRTSPRSDLDLLVVAGERRRVQRRLEGVPVDILVETPESLGLALEREWSARRPVLAHMLATGEVLLDRDGLLEDLRTRARRLMEKPPRAEAWELGLARIDLATALDDALDLGETDPAAAALALDHAVRLAIEYPFREQSRHLPREKDMLRALGTLDPEAAEQAASFAASRDPAERRRLALELSRQVSGEAGFFDWDSG